MSREYDRASEAQELIDEAGTRGVPAYDLKDEEAIAFLKQAKSDDAKAS